MSEVAEIAGRLSEAQKRVLVASKPLMDARVLVPPHVERKRWPPTMIDVYSIAMRRLTPLGLQVRAHLANDGEG